MPPKASKKRSGGATPAQLKKIMNRAATLRKQGKSNRVALRTAWADHKAGKL